MNKRFLFLPLALLLLAFVGCSKSDSGDDTTNTTADNATVINDFVNKTVVPTYESLDAAALELKTSIATLKASPTDANLETARTKWKSLRAVWEQSEGFLIGPVESNDYDPNTDTWPTDYNEMDSLLVQHSTAATYLTESEVAGLPQSLRGYHPIEYIIFGNHGDRKAADITGGQFAYLVGLATDMYDNNIHPLLLSWTTGTKYGDYLINAGKSGNTIYTSVQEAMLAIANGMIDICNEVSQDGEDGKINGPYIGNNNAGDPNIVESPYSGNSWTDFKNNIIGAENVYLGTNNGVGLSAFVRKYNVSLDNTIKSQFTAAINSFDNLGSTYFEDAITDASKRTLIEQTRTAIKTLQNTLETQLADDQSGLIVTYVKD